MGKRIETWFYPLAIDVTHQNVFAVELSHSGEILQRQFFPFLE